MNHGMQDQNKRHRLTLAHEVGAFDSGNQHKQCVSRSLPLRAVQLKVAVKVEGRVKLEPEWSTD
jgi:hypothetical protein